MFVFLFLKFPSICIADFLQVGFLSLSLWFFFYFYVFGTWSFLLEISSVNSLGKIFGVTALHQLHSAALNKMVKSPQADGADVQVSDDACLVALI